MSERRPFRFALFADTHIVPDGADYRGVDCSGALRQAVDSLPSDIDFVVHAGDLVSRPASAPAYQWYSALIAPLVHPIWHIPGNHDDVTLMSEYVPGCVTRYPWSFVHEGVHFVGLDSSGGTVSECELHRLGQLLDEASRCIVFVHHHVCEMDGSWLNEFALENVRNLFAELERHPGKVAGLIHGHIHYHAVFSYGSFPVFSAPSLSTSFAVFGRRLEMAAPSPAFSTFQVHDDGRLEQTRIAIG
jgi:3',5'-cyclic-AMP phosphodiesterase